MQINCNINYSSKSIFSWPLLLSAGKEQSSDISFILCQAIGHSFFFFHYAQVIWYLVTMPECVSIFTFSQNNLKSKPMLWHFEGQRNVQINYNMSKSDQLMMDKQLDLNKLFVYFIVIWSHILVRGGR